MSNTSVQVIQFGFKKINLRSEGEQFLTEEGHVRFWSSEGYALKFLRKTGYSWVVTKLDGSIEYVNCLSLEDEDKYGPHDWEKKNLVTLVDGAGMYDVIRCSHCNEERKCYGLYRPSGGTCKQNILEKELEVDG